MARSEKFYFLGIGTIRDREITCIFGLFFPFVCSIKDRSQYFNFFTYTSDFKCCYHDIILCFVPYFSAESGKKIFVAIYLFPCIKTKIQATVPFDDTIWQHSLYITPTKQTLEDGALLGFRRSWWGRSWLQFKSPGFSDS